MKDLNVHLLKRNVLVHFPHHTVAAAPRCCASILANVSTSGFFSPLPPSSSSFLPFCLPFLFLLPLSLALFSSSSSLPLPLSYLFLLPPSFTPFFPSFIPFPPLLLSFLPLCCLPTFSPILPSFIFFSPSLPPPFPSLPFSLLLSSLLSPLLPSFPPLSQLV